MTVQHVWNHMVEAKRLMEKAREELEAIEPTSIPVEEEDLEPRRAARRLTEVERSLNQAITQARSICFQLAPLLEVNVEVHEDDADPNDLVDP